jgi:hypothetical protein
MKARYCSTSAGSRSARGRPSAPARGQQQVERPFPAVEAERQLIRLPARQVRTLSPPGLASYAGSLRQQRQQCPSRLARAAVARLAIARRSRGLDVGIVQAIARASRARPSASSPGTAATPSISSILPEQCSATSQPAATAPPRARRSPPARLHADVVAHQPAVEADPAADDLAMTTGDRLAGRSASQAV